MLVLEEWTGTETPCHLSCRAFLGILKRLFDHTNRGKQITRLLFKWDPHLISLRGFSLIVIWRKLPGKGVEAGRFFIFGTHKWNKRWEYLAWSKKFILKWLEREQTSGKTPELEDMSLVLPTGPHYLGCKQA